MEHSSFINGNRFSWMADFSIDFDNPTLTIDLYKSNAIVFCKTDLLEHFFKFIQLSNRKYILITHMSDYPINEYRFKLAPGNIVKWFAENALYEDDRLVPIPIGIENHWGNQKGKFTNHEWFEHNSDVLAASVKKDELYCNWNPDTNREVRVPIIQSLEKTGLPIVKESGLSFESYCVSMSSYKWVVCPPGNGADTHRLWEALYMGCYPITLESRIYRWYDLPILQVKRWSDVTPELLDEHDRKWNHKIWNEKHKFDHLRMEWWENHIKEQFQNL